jgi:hypothetical protein
MNRAGDDKPYSSAPRFMGAFLHTLAEPQMMEEKLPHTHRLGFP